MKQSLFGLFCLSLWAMSSALASAEVSLPHHFEGGKKPAASQFNENFQALAAAIGELQFRLEALSAHRSALDSLPKGVILAWYAQSGTIPDGWAVCDGVNGTPDLRNRFLRGVATFADVGIDADAKDTHTHPVSGNVSGTTGKAAESNADGWHVEHGRDRVPHATGTDHTHKWSAPVSASATGGTHIPKNAKVLYIMKVR